MAAGVELDLLTKAEVEELVDKHFAGSEPVPLGAEETSVIDAAGAALVHVYAPPPGMEFRVHLITVNVDTATLANPQTPANCTYAAIAQGRIVDFLVKGAITFPLLRQLPLGIGPIVRNGDTLDVQLAGTGFVAGTTVQVFAQGILIPSKYAMRKAMAAL